MALTITRDDNHFRLESQYFCTSWLPDTSANRKAMLVLLRLMVDDQGKALFTHQQLAGIVRNRRFTCVSHLTNSAIGATIITALGGRSR